MNEEDVFLMEILARPDDDVPRLVYADWLEDHGDERADLIRLDWELRGGPATAPARQKHHLRVADACRAHDWVAYDGLVLTWEQLLLVFRLRLAETIAFCSGREPPFRDDRLNPWERMGYYLVGFRSSSYQDVDWPAMVLQLAIDRRRLLEQAGRTPSRPAGSLQGGRLVFFDPLASIGDGQSALFSNNYFGADSVPPWDTWVMQAPEPSPVARGVPPEYTPHYLIAWVPSGQVARARTGIDVNEEGSLRWLDQVDTPLVHRLREAGLLR